MPVAQVRAQTALREMDGLHTFMRYPNLHGDTVVFVAHGNLWEVSRKGGAARRLTADPGDDFLPRYSPDGQWIAFTASYQGNQDVYVMPSGGGPARRLTFHSDIAAKAPDRWAPDNMVMTWTPDSRSIVFSSRALAWNSWINRPFTVPLTGGLPTPLPLDRSGFMTYGPDGHTVALTRILRDFRTWKRYDGGLAQNVFTYDLNSHRMAQVTDWSGTATQPMWFGHKIYFLADHDSNRRANIWVLDLETHQTRQLTHFTDFDVDFPSLGDSGLTFQQGGALWVMDLPSEELHRLDVTVPDDGMRTMSRPVAAADAIRDSDYAHEPNFAVAPNGRRAALVARGDLFSLPAEHGAVRNLTHSSDADDEHPVFSPDGSHLAYTSDENGEQQIWLRAVDGGPARQLTHFRDGYRYAPIFSADGKQLAFSDNNNRLWVMTIGSDPVPVAQDIQDEIHDQAFSPDGHYLAFSMKRDNHQPGLFLYDIETRQLMPLGGAEADTKPQFSRDGRYLFFTSQRLEHPVFDEHEFNAYSMQSTGIYVAALAASTPAMFGIRSDESGPSEGGKNAGDGADQHAGADAKHTDPSAGVDVYGILSRAEPVPDIRPGVTKIAMRGDRLFYETEPKESIDGATPDGGERSLFSYDVAARKSLLIQQKYDALTLSYDGAFMLWRNGHDWFIAEARPKSEPHKLKVDAMTAFVTPPREWAAMFNEAWRLERDFFYNPMMNGVDWNQIHASYEKLVPLLGSSADFGYLLGQLQGELANSHTYAQSVGEPPGRRFPTALIGADFALDAASGRYRLAHVLRGDNARPAYRAPLAQPGMNVRDGEYLLAVDGEDLRAPTDPYSLFVGRNGPLTLTIAASIEGKRRDVTVEPVESELSLREAEWIRHNRETVDRLSHGQIAYIYLSDMSGLGMQQFIRQFYTQLDRKALMIDDRWNGGGFIDEILLERLRRVLDGMDVTRQGVGRSIPQQLIVGPKVTLINHYSASNGDMFPFYFRDYKLGKLIGTRTWGGVRGIRGMWPLLDGSTISIPETALYDRKSQWVIENHGVDPDIDIENEPADLLAGHDAQLEKGVSVLMDELKANPPVIPTPPAWLPAYPPSATPATHHD